MWVGVELSPRSRLCSTLTQPQAVSSTNTTAAGVAAVAAAAAAAEFGCALEQPGCCHECLYAVPLLGVREQLSQLQRADTDNQQDTNTRIVARFDRPCKGENPLRTHMPDLLIRAHNISCASQLAATHMLVSTGCPFDPTCPAPCAREGGLQPCPLSPLTPCSQLT
jgi:hypothetical protein